MDTKHLISVIALTGSLGLFASNADAQPGRTVDCDNGDSIQAAIDKQVGHSGPITITVSGTCEEDVTIRRDDVTITGNNAATVVGTIRTEGANRVVLNNLTITGPDGGFAVVHIDGGYVSLFGVNVDTNGVGEIGIYVGAATVNASDVVVEGPFSEGMRFINGGHGRVNNSTFKNNEIGMNVAIASSATLFGNTFQFNDVTGLAVNESSSAGIFDGNLFDSNGIGVGVNSSASLQISGSTITNNQNWGLDVAVMSFVNFYPPANTFDNPDAMGDILCTRRGGYRADVKQLPPTGTATDDGTCLLDLDAVGGSIF